MNLLYRLPRQIPPVPVLLADLCNPTAAAVAHALDVSERTVWRWTAADVWPRPAHLALFFASRWGWSAVECDALHAVHLAQALAESRHAEVNRLRLDLAHLGRLGDFGAANSPLLGLAVAARAGREFAPTVGPFSAPLALAKLAV